MLGYRKKLKNAPLSEPLLKILRETFNIDWQNGKFYQIQEIMISGHTGTHLAHLNDSDVISALLMYILSKGNMTKVDLPCRLAARNGQRVNIRAVCKDIAAKIKEDGI